MASLRAALPKPPTSLRLLFRHQVGAIVATVVDLGAMTLLVEARLLQPEMATAFGAACGAVTNFFLGRKWVFGDTSRRSQRSIANQAARYALVTALSLAWNTLGEGLLHRGLGLHYFVARVLVALTVNLAWNYPMHRFFVFGAPKGATSP